MDDQFERAPIAQPDRGKTPDGPRREATNTESFRQSNDRRIHETEVEIRVPLVNLHCPRELIERRWRVSKCTTCKIEHENTHRCPRVAKKVIDFPQHQTRHVARPRTIDGLSKAPMIVGTFDDVVDQRAGSQIRAAALPAATKQLALVAELRQ